MALKGLKDFCAIRRLHVVSDKRFRAELSYADLLRRCQRMPRVDYKRELVAIDHDRLERRFFGIERQHAEFGGVLEDIIRYAAGQRPQYSHLDHRVQPPKLRQHRQQIKACEFVGGASLRRFRSFWAYS